VWLKATVPGQGRGEGFLGRVFFILAAALSASLSVSSHATELHDAVKNGSTETAIALIDKGADINAREPDNTTALHYAAHRGDVVLVERLLRARAKASVYNDYGSTPLSEAAAIGNARAIKLLLDAGADVNSPNHEGQTALMAVARTGNVEGAKLLLRHRADVNAKEKWGGQSALMWAAAQSHPDMIKLLVAHGADVNARGAVRDWQRRSTAEPRPKGMNRGGFTPLLYAAREGCIECAKQLLKAKADINLPDPDRTTPLVMALLNLHFDFAAYLISAGADVDKWDFYGQTPLYVAIDMNTLPQGGRPDLFSEDRTTALQVAERLLKAGANPNIQLKLRPPYRNYIFDRGRDEVLSTGATPLLRAARASDLPAIALLLKYKALPNLANASGVTPIMAASGVGYGDNPTRGRYKADANTADAIRTLKDAGGEINGHAGGGETALHAAAAHGWNETIKVLIASGAELEAVDRRGLRPIDYAVGRQERGFLATEQPKRTDTIALLTEHIVAKTGRKPKEFEGTPVDRQRGPPGAAGL
jgi:uncharacterized protein